MPKKALVFIRYGPYESCGLVEYRTFRLQGLQTMLHKEGHRCVLQEILDWDTVELIVNGEKIFQCNIKNLEFGGDGKLDPLCKEAAVAVLNAY
ncbi:UPF0728 protein C10orf53 homolog [Latimeria chalumnae]|uniref:UPF0728 protein C10orf53 homolog n=1 Tax=Latimeria chalumnae TaxID=7897 RepID=UPI00313D89A9